MFQLLSQFFVYRFEFLPYSVNLNYQSSLLHTREEVAVVILGPLMNILILGLLVAACAACQRILGSFPDLFCKFVIVYGLHTFFDPVLIAIVDAPLGVREIHTSSLKVPGPIASDCFQTLGDFGFIRKLIFFSLPLSNFTAQKCTVWKILIKM